MDATLPPFHEAPRRPWRALALLTLAVALVHVGVLGLAPLGNEPEALPLTQHFSTRTIVIAPPAPAPAPAAAPPAQAAPAAAPKRPSAQLRKAPRPRPPPEAAPAPEPPSPVLAGDTDTEATAPPSPAEPAPPPAEPAPAEAGQGEGSGAPAAASGQGEASGETGAGGTPGATRALQVPGSVTLDFAVTGQQGPQPLSGVFGELVWLQDGGQYNARLSLKMLFRTLRAQTSVGRVGPDGIEPLRFSDRRKSEVATHFVREGPGAGEIVFSSSNQRVPLAPGAQDRLSVVMQIVALLAGDPAAYPAGSRIAMQTAGPRDAETWTFTVDGDETLDMPAGHYQARKLTRLPRKEMDQKIELWLAPEIGWLPVRIRQTQPDGDFADMQLRGMGAPRPAE
ncbi:DUF3108 domain-containing protein [Xenophilus sp.]|uniref:DUF3108 domain-containing protein n=1 Tax=Xenophilus sp. TaxID=1873499 RepID=UPI0037DD5D76